MNSIGVTSCGEMTTRSPILVNPQKFGGEPGGEPDATVRGPITGNDAEMHGDARPRDALHERHRCARVDIRAMVSLGADYGEHALGRRMAEHASRNRRAVDEPVVIEYGDALVSDRNNTKQRPLAVIDFGALLRPGAEGAPPIFELLSPYTLRAVQGWSLSNDEE